MERSGTEYMNWLNKLERKFGNWAIPNLIVWLIGPYTIGFVLYQVNPSIIGLFDVEPVSHPARTGLAPDYLGVCAPQTRIWVYLFIMALFYYQLGTTLERTWGTFRFNVYIFRRYAVYRHRSVSAVRYHVSDERRCDDGDASHRNEFSAQVTSTCPSSLRLHVCMYPICRFF